MAPGDDGFKFTFRDHLWHEDVKSSNESEAMVSGGGDFSKRSKLR